MHRYFILLLLIIIFPTFLLAQSYGNITGRLVTNTQHLEYATVSLFKTTDSTVVLQQTITDSSGKFILSNINFGDYVLKISLIGYLPKTININISSNNLSINFNDIEMVTENIALNNLTVKSQKKFIQKTNEGFIVNAAANITQIGGTATDLLRSTPTVNVDADGVITLRGKKPLILINNRNSSFSNIDQIPASSIESIEIINNASAKYDANAQSGIINIRLRKNKLRGTNGAFSLGAGLGSRGRTANSFILNHKTQKWNLGAAYDNRFAGRTKLINGNRINYNLSDNYLLTQIRNDERFEDLQNLKLNTDFSPNNKNSFSFEGILSKEGQDNNESLSSVVRKQNNSFNYSNVRNSLEIQKAKLAEFALGYNRKFTNPEKSLTINLTSSFDNAKENTAINTQNVDESQINLGSPTFQRTHNYEHSNVSDIIIDYATPILAASSLEMGYKGTFRYIKNDYEAADKIGTDFIVNPYASNIFTFKEQINAAYLLFHSFFGKEESTKWKYDIGIRAEQVSNNGVTQTSSTKFNNNYFKLFPTVSVNYQIDKLQALKISYAKRINRPDLDDLNPFVDITDALNPHSGNPNLKPEIIQVFELGYSGEWSKYSYTTNLFYRHAQNTIRNFTKPLGGGVVLRLPINIGNANSLGLENIVIGKPLAMYDFNFSTTIFQQTFSGSDVEAETNQKGFNWNAKLINNFSIGQRSKLQLIGNYNGAQITPQGKSIAIYNVDIGMQQKLGKGNSRLGLIIVDVFNTLRSGGYNTTNEFYSSRFQKADTRAIMITFAHSFKSNFKENLLDNKFSKEY